MDFVCRKCHRELDEIRRHSIALLNNVDPAPVRTVEMPVYDLPQLGGAVDGQAAR